MFFYYIFFYFFLNVSHMLQHALMIQKKGKMILTVYWWKLPKQFLLKHRWTLHFSQKIKENPLQPGILHRCLVLLQFGMCPKLSVLTSFGGIAVEDDFFFFCSKFRSSEEDGLSLFFESLCPTLHRQLAISAGNFSIDIVAVFPICLSFLR